WYVCRTMSSPFGCMVPTWLEFGMMALSSTPTVRISRQLLLVESIVWPTSSGFVVVVVVVGSCCAGIVERSTKMTHVILWTVGFIVVYAVIAIVLVRYSNRG